MRDTTKLVLLAADAETGELFLAELSEEGRKEYNDPDYDPGESVWSEWQEFESYSDLLDAAWNVLGLKE